MRSVCETLSAKSVFLNNAEGIMNHKVKITVLRREYYQDLAERFLVNPKAGKCSIFQEGQEFTVTRENYERFPFENHFAPQHGMSLK